MNYPPNVVHYTKQEQDEVIPHSGGMTRREVECELASEDRAHYHRHGEHLYPWAHQSK